jgi:hypothetical protein
MTRLRRAAFAAAVLAALAGAAPAAADLLVTRDGVTIETRGPWQVEGRRVIFTLPNGTLSSIRTEEVDLDRSALETARAAEAAAAVAEEPAPVAAEPILRLTEDDLPKQEEGEPGEGEETKPEGEAPKGPLEVQSFEKSPLANDDGVQLFGVVRNTSRNTLTAVTVTAVIYGDEGGMIANGDAQLNRTTIGPGETANFRVEFPGVPDFTSVKFETGARGFETRRDAAEGEAGEEGGAGEAEGEEAAAPPPSEQSAEERAAEAEAEAIATYNQNVGASSPPPSEPPPGDR